jgi:hypothetical protein
MLKKINKINEIITENYVNINWIHQTDSEKKMTRDSRRARKEN